MAAGVFGKNQIINSTSGVITASSLIGSNTYEKILVYIDKIGPNPGAVNVGKATAPDQVSTTIFGDVIETGDMREYYESQVPNAAVGIGTNLGFFNPSTEDVRIRMLGFATA